MPDLGEWESALSSIFKGDKSAALKKRLLEDHESGKEIYPPSALFFRALELTSPSQVKVVILGQDPYHGPGQATGLAFSVPEGVDPPPSLQNIFKELASDLGLPFNEQFRQGDLSSWASQGVLLLNTRLSVLKGKPLSHAGIGWEEITSQVIRIASSTPQRVVFLLWGAEAAKAKALINAEINTIIESPHPSPLSAYRGFFGSRPFSRANKALIESGQTPIRWESVFTRPS